jgi:hypothetical protein
MFGGDLSKEEFFENKYFKKPRKIVPCEKIDFDVI